MKHHRSGAAYLITSLFWAIFGLLDFSHGVRAVAIFGLFFSGAAFGVFLVRAITMFRRAAHHRARA